MAKRKRTLTKTPVPQPYQVFVSHATYDKWVATVLCEKLEAVGVATFRDDCDIDGGGDIAEAIRDSISQCSEVLVLISPESVERRWVVLEIGMAFMAKKRIVPILLHATADQLPGIIDHKRAFDINRFDAYLADLLKRKESHDSKTH